MVLAGCRRLSLISILSAAALCSCTVFNSERAHRSLEYRVVTTMSASSSKIGEPFGIVVRDDSIYVSDGEAGTIAQMDAAGIVTTFARGLRTPSALAFMANGDLIVADTGSHTIKKVDASGTVTKLAGVENTSGSVDGPSNVATFNGPVGIAIADDETIYVSDTYNDRIRMIRDGVVSTVAGTTRGFADGEPANAAFNTPLGIAIWNDRLLVADSGNHRIRVVENNGPVWTLAGTGDEGLLDGPPLQASFVMPTAVAAGPNGAIFVDDGNAIRVIGRRPFPFVETISNDRRGYVDGNSGQARFNRPSGIAIGSEGQLLIADSDNRAVRAISDDGVGRQADPAEIDSLRPSTEEFRNLQPPRWPYDPPMNPREVAGTLGEIRGEISRENGSVWFHNGLDIAGAYGEIARFIRTETVLDPNAVRNFNTARELIRMPTIGYIHLRLGRDSNNVAFADKRFQFERDLAGRPIDLRVPRGSTFRAGEMLGTLNSQNHVHLIAGPPGAEMNALAALRLPGIGDSIAPVIERVELLDEDWSEVGNDILKVDDKRRIVVEAYDRMDGNVERRRLGVYRLGYQILSSGGPVTGIDWTIVFDRMPAGEAVRFAYGPGSRSGATGQTRFRYVVTNRIGDTGFAEGFLDLTKRGPGSYTLRAYAADYFGNTTSKDLRFEVSK